MQLDICGDESRPTTAMFSIWFSKTSQFSITPFALNITMPASFPL